MPFNRLIRNVSNFQLKMLWWEILTQLVPPTDYNKVVMNLLQNIWLNMDITGLIGCTGFIGFLVL